MYVIHTLPWGVCDFYAGFLGCMLFVPRVSRVYVIRTKDVCDSYLGFLDFM